jgi:hypothetical protein
VGGLILVQRSRREGAHNATTLDIKDFMALSRGPNVWVRVEPCPLLFDIFSSFSHHAFYVGPGCYSQHPINWDLCGERGLSLDHSTIARWVLRYVPTLSERIRGAMRRPNRLAGDEHTLRSRGRACKSTFEPFHSLARPLTPGEQTELKQMTQSRILVVFQKLLHLMTA